jgi:hypothetical protein
MEQIADSQLMFGSLPGALPPSQVYAGLIAVMSRPASNVLSLPVATSAIQDDELTSPLTSPVVASLSQFLSEDLSRSIEKQLIEAELLNAETPHALPDALIQVEVPDVPDVPEELVSMLPIMPSLDHDNQSEDKKEDKSPATDYHSSGFQYPYSDDDDSLMDDKRENPNMIEECIGLLINLKSAVGPLTNKTKDKPTDKKKPKSKRKQSSLPLQAPLSPEVEEKPKPKRRTSSRRANALAKEAELARAEALAREASVAEEAYVWFKKRTVPTKEEAAASLKKPPIYPMVAVAAAAPSGDGGCDDDSTDTDDHLPFPVDDDDDDNFDQKTPAKDHHSHDPVDNNDDDDDDDDNDNDGNNDNNDDPETPARDLCSKSHKKRASRNLPPSSIKTKKTLVRLKVCVRDSYSTMALWPFKPVETKRRKKRRDLPLLSLPPS